MSGLDRGPVTLFVKRAVASGASAHAHAIAPRRAAAADGAWGSAGAARVQALARGCLMWRSRGMHGLEEGRQYGAPTVPRADDRQGV